MRKALEDEFIDLRESNDGHDTTPIVSQGNPEASADPDNTADLNRHSSVPGFYRDSQLCILHVYV